MVMRLFFAWQINRLLRRNKFEAAEAACRYHIKRSPRDAGYHYLLSRVLWKQQSLDEAVEELRVTIGLRAATLSADRIDLVRILLEAGRYEEVLRECEHLTDPNFHKVSGIFRKMHEYAAYEARYQAYVGLESYHEAKQALELMLPYQKGRGREQLLENIRVCEGLLDKQNRAGS